MADLSGTPGEIQFTLQVTRKETGKVEEFQMVGYVGELPERDEEQKEQE